MMVTVAVYQSQQSGTIEWTTLALGPLNQSQRGPSAVKVQRSLTEALKRAAREIPGPAWAQLRLPKGLQLQRQRLDLTLDDAGGKAKFTGTFPLVLEKRWINAETRIDVVYHPLRQGEWFPLGEGESLRERAELYFRKAWARLDSTTISNLQTDGKDRLRVLSLQLTPPSLLDQLPDRKQSIWDDLDPNLFQKGGKRKKEGGFKVLRKVGADQTQRAADGTLPLGMARELYRAQLEALLGGRERRPTLVVGPPQSGKSTLLARWIDDLLQAEGYAAHRNLDRVTHVWAISGRRLIAGMSYLGDWEQRCLELVADAQRHRVILLVDDIHTFGRLGRSRESDRNLAELFRGPLTRGELILVGECSSEQLTLLEDDAPSFAALFTQVHIKATGQSETLRMMVHEARALERTQWISFDPLIHQQVLELTASLYPAAAFPGKALDLLRELARRSGGGSRKARCRVGANELLAAVAASTGLPVELLAPQGALTIDELREGFERHVMGQREAVDTAAELVLRIRANLTDPRRPYAVYLFTGPTGTGKTELAKCIAAYLYGSTERLLRFDMGEYGGADATARLAGDRHQPRGLLTEQVRQQPFCVLLLDEIEKAHPAVLNLLLQVFDEGRLTDAAGTTSDFTHAVIILTSNLGARTHAAVGYEEDERSHRHERAQAVRDFFPPELFNRIDRVVPFAPLDAAAARRIAAKELGELLARRGLAERNIFVYPSDGVLDRVVAAGFDPLYGARTVKRYLERHIGSLLANEIAATPPASLRVFHLYTGGTAAGGTKLHSEMLSEAAMLGSELPLEPLFELPVRELADRLPGTLDYLDSLLADEALQRLAERLRFHLGEHNRGEGGHANALFNLDSLRGQLRQLRGRVGYLHLKKRSDRRQILQCLAEVVFLKRALARVEDAEQHAIFIELSHVGLTRRAHRFHRRPAGLLESLTEAYLGQQLLRCEFEGWALRDADGRLREGDDGRPTFRESEHLILRIFGLGALDFFGGERGCHSWRSLSQGTDVLRVDVRPAKDDESPLSLLRQHLAAERTFRRALEAGGDTLPENPLGLLPLARSYRFDPPAEGKPAADLELEDYLLGYAGTQRVRSIADGLHRIWLLRMSRQEGAEQSS